jgi:hypothetical protein
VGPLEATDVKRTAISLRWNEPETDGGSPITSFLLEMREAKRTLWSKVTTLKPDVLDYQASFNAVFIKNKNFILFQYSARIFY